MPAKPQPALPSVLLAGALTLLVVHTLGRFIYTPLLPWLVEDGLITEATSSNAHIIDQRGVLVSHPVDRGVLPGVTRICVMEIARGMGLTVEERPFTPDELYAAREAFCSAASALVLPVVEVDGKPIGGGKAGAITAEIRKRYIALLRAG